MNIVIAVPVDESLAEFIGKKGSVNSITFYNRKMENDVVVALYPNQDEEKTYALAQSLLIAQKVVLSTSTIDRKFGEALVAASLLGRTTLMTDDNDAEGILRGSGMSNYRVVPRDKLLDEIRSNPDTAGDSGKGVRVEIDKAFPVKGVGTVALGFVTRGTLKQHDKLYHTSGKQVVVRSIQSQDIDVVSAEKGARVGVSLKDISHEEIEKGDLLTPELVKKSARLVIEYKTSKVAAEKVSEGSYYRLVLGFSFSDCAVTRVGDGEMELDLKAPMPAEVGDEVLLIRKEVPRVFAYGKVKKALAQQDQQHK
jgi:selenocysteine-specific translation elongation factor